MAYGQQAPCTHFKDSQAEGNHYERHVEVREPTSTTGGAEVGPKKKRTQDFYSNPEFRKRETGSITGTGSR